jgi:hypothetical protein
MEQTAGKREGRGERWAERRWSQIDVPFVTQGAL